MSEEELDLQAKMFHEDYIKPDNVSASLSNEMLCGNGKFCKWLESRFTGMNEKGINPVIAIENNKSKVLGVNFLRTKKDDGLMFRFCPYCGEKIDYYKAT